jgi:hypothetical protein
MIAELAVETSLSPRELIDLDAPGLWTMLDVLQERADQLK